MDPQENYEFLNIRKSQMKKCLQKDSKLDVLNMRIEESCQSELDQIPTDAIPYKNNQTQQISNLTSQYEEQNFTVLLNENFDGTHIISCLWFLVGYIELEYLGEEQTWFDQSIAANDRNWAKLYISSLYWSLTLMTTGSNQADTVLQIAFTSFIMLFTTIIFGYLLNIIGIILSEVDQEEENERRDMNQINSYMRKRSISKNLQRGINLDLEYYYHHNFKKDDEQNQIVLSKISENLLQDLKKEYFGRFLNQMEIITRHFSQETQQKILLFIEEQNYLPGQVINNYQNYDESRLIYIVEGQGKQIFSFLLLIVLFCLIILVEIIKSDNSGIEFVIDSYGKNKLIGQIAFFQGRQDGIIIKAVDFTQVISIPRDKFLETVKQNDLDFQKFCKIKDKISFYQDFEDIKVKCENCQSFKHQQYNCPLVHFDKQREKVVQNYNYYLKQFRQNFNRKPKCKYNTLMIQQQTQKYCKLLCTKMDFQEAQVSSTSINNLESIYEGQGISQKEINPLNNNIRTLRSHSQIVCDEDENKPHSQEIVKKKAKGAIIKKNSQQIFLNLDTQVSNHMQDEGDGSERSIKDKLYLKETSIVTKMMDGSTPQTTQMSQLNFKNFLKAVTQQCLYKLSKLENILKVLPGQQIAIGKQLNQNSFREIAQIVNTDKIIWEFDQKKDYTIYFPEGNSGKIISSFNQKQKKKRKTFKPSKRKMK